MNPNTTHPQMNRSAGRFRASQMIDCNITNARNEDLGSVQDLVLANDDRSIAYVVVAFGGFLGMGEKYFAMPWRLIKASPSTPDTEPRITLAVEPEVLKTAPGFDKDAWPDMADTKWARLVDDFYSTRGTGTEAATMPSKRGTPLVESRTGSSGRDPDSEAFQYRRVSQLLGMNVLDANRETLAEVDDLILDGERGQIEGAALTFGGVMGIGKHIALVPVESLTLDRHKGTFAMPCSTADLEALALPGGEWPRIDGDEWLTRGRHQCDRARTATRSNQSSATAREA